jgi:2,4-dienoyl-CoA reductase-like NADH-dependent reductase (Old Yellow Enzyme family)
LNIKLDSITTQIQMGSQGSSSLEGENLAVPDMPYFIPLHRITPGSAIDVTDSTPTLFQPLQIRSKILRNRILVAPMCQYSCAARGPEIGKLTDWHLATLGHYAVKGAGLVMIEATAVQPNGRITPNDSGLWNDEQTDGVRRVSDFIRSQGALSAIQLAHAGRKGSTATPWTVKHGSRKQGLRATARLGGWPEDVVGPTGGLEQAWDAKGLSEEGAYWPPRELTISDIRALLEDYANAARRSVLAGIDVIEVHAAHGYLLHEFLSPATNRRTDQYGGSFENRTRLLREVVQAVRQVIPQSMPLFLRISSTEYLEGTEIAQQTGCWTVDDSIRLARLLPDLGVDLLDVSSGGNHVQQRIGTLFSEYQTRAAGQIRKAIKAENLNLLVGAVGLITEAEQARDLVQAKGNDGTGIKDAEPVADVVLAARQFLREPEWVMKVGKTLGVELAWANQFNLHVR